MEDLRFSRNEPALNGLVSPPRNGNRLAHSMSMSSHDSRTALPRRFTTDSGRVPTLSTITGPRALDHSQEYASVRLFYVPLAPGVTVLAESVELAWDWEGSE